MNGRVFSAFLFFCFFLIKVCLSTELGVKIHREGCVVRWNRPLSLYTHSRLFRKNLCLHTWLVNDVDVCARHEHAYNRVQCLLVKSKASWKMRFSQTFCASSPFSARSRIRPNRFMIIIDTDKRIRRTTHGEIVETRNSSFRTLISRCREL